MAKQLVYVDDSLPGITRRRYRNAWQYFSAEGERITDRDEIDRLNAIALPPAYVDAWFAPGGNAHILATGIDARGRKQYRYHPDFRAARECRKFDACAGFGKLLPLIRARVEEDLFARGLDRTRAVASIVRLLDTGHIRVGNESYAKQNKSFGATTLRRRHAKLSGGTLNLRFKAKSGKQCEMSVSDRGLIRFVKAMQDLPGQHLFQYLCDDGETAPVTSQNVNDYIRETMGDDFTAKHFRTWRASALAFAWLADETNPSGLKPMVEHVADHLGNTPAMARKSYIHPAMIDLAKSGGKDFREQLQLPRATKWLTRHERALIEYLETGPQAEALLAA